VKPLHFVLLAVLTIASHPSAFAIDQATFEQHRNGTQTGAAYARDAHKLRRFLWQHWLRRERGEAKVNWSTVEGDTGTSVYTIAPGDDRAWRVSVHLEGSERAMAPGETAHWRSERWEAFALQRVKRPKTFDERLSPRVPITHTRALPESEYLLDLKDKDGKLLEEL
jgi:hypothetical protein